MLVQTQEKGSYRTDDMIAFLDWALPTAACPSESIVVILDWFAPHLSEEVHELVSSKGHVLLHHGGGVTGLEQVNDTHLHACLQRLMEQAEVRIAHEKRKENPDKVPKLNRQEIVDLTRQARAFVMSVSFDNAQSACVGRLTYVFNSFTYVHVWHAL